MPIPLIEKLPEICAQTCKITSEMVDLSDYKHLGHGAFEVIQNATTIAEKFLSYYVQDSISFGNKISPCRFFAYGQRQFFNELQRNPEIAKGVNELPKYAVCKLQNAANEGVVLQSNHIKIQKLEKIYNDMHQDVNLLKTHINALKIQNDQNLNTPIQVTCLIGSIALIFFLRCLNTRRNPRNKMIKNIGTVVSIGVAVWNAFKLSNNFL